MSSMKPLSFARLFGKNWLAKPARRKARASSSLRLRTRAAHLFVEALEDRTLLAVLPVPTVTAHFAIANPLSKDLGNESSPSIAIDSANPKKLVAVYTRLDANAN